MAMTMDDDGAILIHLTNPGGIVGGTGVANQIAYWTDTDTIGGDPGLTYNAATDTLSLANSLTFTGATGVNDVTIPDNLADALSLDDAGGLNYLQIVSTNTQPVVRWNPASADIDFHISATGETNALFMRGNDGNVGIGTTGDPIYVVDIFRSNANSMTRVRTTGAGNYGAIFIAETDDSKINFGAYDDGYITVTEYAGKGVFQTTGNLALVAYSPSTADIEFYAGGRTVDKRYMIIKSTGVVGIGAGTPLARLHVDQYSASGAIPVLLLDQADLSEEFIELKTTVGAGNPIDTAAIGTYYGKMRVNVTGVGYKYIALYNS
jgi:hypothetical protein